MLAAGFVSYVGSFDQINREILWKNIWTADLEERKIPLTSGMTRYLLQSCGQDLRVCYLL